MSIKIKYPAHFFHSVLTANSENAVTFVYHGLFWGGSEVHIHGYLPTKIWAFHVQVDCMIKQNF